MTPIFADFLARLLFGSFRVPDKSETRNDPKDNIINLIRENLLHPFLLWSISLHCTPGPALLSKIPFSGKGEGAFCFAHKFPLSRISDLLYLRIYHIFQYHKKVVYHNLRNAFPDKSQDEIFRIGKKIYRHFCDLIVEVLKMLSINR
jgi:hypothetical protein